MRELIARLDQHLRKAPVLGKHVYIARTAVVIGDVTIGESSSVWYHAVLRGDINRIAIGHHTNIQDNTVVHLAEDLPCILGNHVTIGHSAIIHACIVKDATLIGMGATILDGAVIGSQSIVGANSLVPQRMKIPPRSLAMGSPARVVRQLTAEEVASLLLSAEKYAANGAYCLKHRINLRAPMHGRNRRSPRP
jgi:carbonic anhydrase/acetyltransferase-like protein (isoleucine patch superfamily)